MATQSSHTPGSEDVEAATDGRDAGNGKSSSNPAKSWCLRFESPWHIRKTFRKRYETISKTSYPSSWLTSFGNLFKAISWMGGLLIALPFAWSAHWNVGKWGPHETFWLCFVTMIPLQRIFDWCAEEAAVYLGRDLQSFIVITLNNAIEATLAIILLLKCELRLLQSTIVGVVLLHLLLVPGTEFFIHGAENFELPLHPRDMSINSSLLMVGVLSMVVPTAFFAALDTGTSGSTSSTQSTGDTGLPPKFVPLVNDFVRRDILRMSRGASVVLLVIYIVSRFYRHMRPDDSSNASNPPPTPESQSDSKGSNVHPVVLLLVVVVTISFMGVTAEFLVSSIEGVRQTLDVQTEFFGLVILPVISFSSDGIIAIYKFSTSQWRKVRSTFPATASPNDPVKTTTNPRRPPKGSGASRLPRDSENEESSEDEFFDGRVIPDAHTRLDPTLLSHGRPIDLSIQFTLLWMPVLVLLGWWTDRPMHLLFDYLEIAFVLGACLLVNFVTEDNKANISEGMTMMGFYAIIATAVWFYPGQPQVAFMLNCPGSVAQAVAQGTEG